MPCEKCYNSDKFTSFYRQYQKILCIHINEIYILLVTVFLTDPYNTLIYVRIPAADEIYFQGSILLQLLVI